MLDAEARPCWCCDVLPENEGWMRELHRLYQLALPGARFFIHKDQRGPRISLVMEHARYPKSTSTPVSSWRER